MAYANPKDRKQNPLKMNVSDDEFQLICAAANINSMQPATFSREVLIAFIRAMDAQQICQFVEHVKLKSSTPLKLVIAR